MHKTKSELYELVRNLMTEEEFESEIKMRFDEYEGMLSELSIAYLIVDENGKNIPTTLSISDIKHGDSVSLDVKVDEIKDPKEFERKNKTRGQVLNIIVSDKTGRCRLTLWDKDVETVKNSDIKIDSKLRIVNGCVKVTDFGTEINLGKWGVLFIDGKKMPLQNQL